MSLIATILMAMRYREQWFLWVVVYIVSIIMWATTFHLLMLIMSIACFISCFIGYISWSIGIKKQTVQNKEKQQKKEMFNQSLFCFLPKY